jgi:hypothetical protein
VLICCTALCLLLARLGPREMSDLSPKRDPKRTLLRPQSPIAIYEYKRPCEITTGFECPALTDCQIVESHRARPAVGLRSQIRPDSKARVKACASLSSGHFRRPISCSAASAAVGSFTSRASSPPTTCTSKTGAALVHDAAFAMAQACQTSAFSYSLRKPYQQTCWDIARSHAWKEPLQARAR